MATETMFASFSLSVSLLRMSVSIRWLVLGISLRSFIGLSGRRVFNLLMDIEDALLILNFDNKLLSLQY
jgi:hypothetical protein